MAGGTRVVTFDPLLREVDPLLTLAPRRVLDHGLLTSQTVLVQTATTLFVDLTGFTATTERMTRVGSRGVERLSDRLRGFFGDVADTVTAAGGDLLAFGGDAITAVFDGPPAASLDAAAAAAEEIAHLAWRSSGRPDAHSSETGPIRLEARIGIARGEVATTVVRSSRRSIPVHLGRGLDLAVAAQATAGPGRPVIDPSARAPEGGSGDPRPVASTPAGLPAPATELARLAPALVVDRMTAGRPQLRSHRRVCVGFVRFPGVAVESLPGFLPTIGSLLDRVDAWEGEVVQVSGGDKGLVAMVVFGAPLAHGDDPLRATEAMLQLRDEDGSVAVGVATGPVYAALLGSRHRLLPTHVGLAVTTAARLMERARPGQLLVDGDTWAEVAAHVSQIGPSEAVPLKGHQQPVDVHAVRGWRTSRRLASPSLPALVGRASEMTALERFLDGLGEGRGGHLELVGLSGIGKTRLVQEALDRARTRSFAVASADTQDYPRGQAHGLWRDLLGAVLGVPGHGTPEQWRGALTTGLPDAGAHVAVLDRLLGGGLASGAGTAAPEVTSGPGGESLGRELVQGLLADLLLAASRSRPLLVAIENVDRLSSDDAQVVTGLTGLLAESRTGVLTTRRVDQDEVHADQSDHPERPAGLMAGRIRLSELGPDDAALVAADAWREAGGGYPPPWLEGAAVAEAGGHPLYLRAVTSVLRDSWSPGEPPPRPRGTTGSGASAGALGAVLAERLDRLDDRHRGLVAVLAVASAPCATDVVAELASGVVDEAEALLVARQLAARRLVEIDERASRPRLRLTHEVLRQTVYDSLSHAERDALHRRFADCLARRDGDPVEIAHHVEALGHTGALAQHWFPLAAASARQAWNLHEAVRFLELARPLLTGHEREQAEVELLELLLVSGRPNELLERAADPHASSDSDPRLAARRLQGVAAAAYACGRYDESETAARRAMRLSDGSDEVLYQRAAELLVLVRCARGETRAAVRAAEELVDRASGKAAPRAVATAEAALGAALLLSGRATEAAVPYEAALTGARNAGDAVLQVHVLSDLAGCAFETGQHERCIEMLGEARRIAYRIGYRRHLAVNLCNEAQLRAARGDPYATACAAVAVQRSLEMGDLALAADSVHTWLAASTREGARPDYLRRLRDIDQRLERTAAAAGDSADLALAAARAGARDEALRAATIADRAARGADLPRVRRRVALARALCALHGSSPDADSGFDLLMAGLGAEDDVDPVEAAEFAVERWRASPGDTGRRDAIEAVMAAFDYEPSTRVRAWFPLLGVPVPEPPAPLPPPAGMTTPLTDEEDLVRALSRLESMVAAVRSGWSEESA